MSVVWRFFCCCNFCLKEMTDFSNTLESNMSDVIFGFSFVSLSFFLISIFAQTIVLSLPVSTLVMPSQVFTIFLSEDIMKSV